jgi:hypothetical protein
MFKPFRLNSMTFTRTIPFSAGRFQAHHSVLSRSLSIPRHSAFHTTPFHNKAFHRVRTIARYTGYFAISSAFGVLALGAGIFIHDAFTYSDQHVDRVPVSPLALHPELGGPKNLPIARVQVDDEQDEENQRLAGKPKLVILGGGWGVSFVHHPCPLLNWTYFRLWACFKPCTRETIMSLSFRRTPSPPLLLFFHVCEESCS